MVEAMNTRVDNTEHEAKDQFLGGVGISTTDPHAQTIENRKRPTTTSPMEVIMPIINPTCFFISLCLPYNVFTTAEDD